MKKKVPVYIVLHLYLTFSFAKWFGFLGFFAEWPKLLDRHQVGAPPWGNGETRVSSHAVCRMLWTLWPLWTRHLDHPLTLDGHFRLRIRQYSIQMCLSLSLSLSLSRSLHRHPEGSAKAEGHTNVSRSQWFVAPIRLLRTQNRSWSIEHF
jgi:hypothetical protein